MGKWGPEPPLSHDHEAVSPGPAPGSNHVLSWAAEAVAPGSRVTGITGLREGGNPWLLRLERSGTAYRAIVKTGDPATAQQRKQLSTQVAALAVAEHHVVAAPRVIAADLTASEAGELALVTTVLPGRSTIPPTMPAGRARRLGAMAATLHAVPLGAAARSAVPDPPSARCGLRRMAPLGWHVPAAGQGRRTHQRTAGAWWYHSR